MTCLTPVPLGRAGLALVRVNHVDEYEDAVYFFERGGLEIASVFVGHVRNGMRTEMLKVDWLRFAKPYYAHLDLVPSKDFGPYVARRTESRYALTGCEKVKIKEPRTIYLHQEILGVRNESGDRIHAGLCTHLDGDTLNNVRSNLYHPCVELMPRGLRAQFGRPA